jgi:hypothetical protein
MNYLSVCREACMNIVKLKIVNAIGNVKEPSIDMLILPNGYNLKNVRFFLQTKIL